MFGTSNVPGTVEGVDKKRRAGNDGRGQESDPVVCEINAAAEEQQEPGKID
jgi:hypothetical protein